MIKRKPILNTIPKNSSLSSHKLYSNLNLQNVWRFKFGPIPSNLEINEIIKCPFQNLQLMHVIPVYIEKKKKTKNISSLCHQNLKIGIPDPWLEFIFFEIFLKRSNYLNNIQKQKRFDVNITKTLYEDYGIIFTNGIPDPWKGWLKCDENGIDDTNTKDEFRKNKFESIKNKFESLKQTKMKTKSARKYKNSEKKHIKFNWDLYFQKKKNKH